MKVLTYVVLLACTVAVPALAADGPAPVLDPATEVLATPAVGSCNAPLGEALFASSGGKGGSLVTCTADCGPYTDVSCQTNGTCVAVDRNCPSTPGYVTCNGVTTYCPACTPPPECSPEGSFRIIRTGNCCDCGLEERIREKCVNGQWEFFSIFCGPNTGPCPFCP